MNKLIIAIIVVLVLVVGGAYLVGLNETEAPADTDTQDQTQQEDMNTDTEDEMENGTTTEEGMPEPVTINITGENFEFPEDEIRVPKGAEITINFTSTDGFHNWAVDQFDAATERVNTDGSSSVTFIADTAGSFPFYCSVGNHRHLGMEGTLIVE